MAPEQTAGRAEDARTDVHAVGLLLRDMLGAGAAPALAALAAQAAAADPAARFPDAAALVAALETAAAALEGRRPGRRRRLALAIAAAAAVAAAGGWLAGYLAGAPRTAVVVADVENETGDPALDGLSGLLATALEPSARLSLLPRAPLLDLAPEGTSRLGPAASRAAAARLGADVVLVLAVRADRGGYAVELRAHEPAGGTDAPRFELAERSAERAGLPAAVDRLAARARRALDARDEAARGGGVGEVLTADLEAYRLHFLGEQCAQRPLHGQDCAEPFRRAVARDPGFAVAHYWLAVWNAFNGDRVEERHALARAVEHAARAPEKERLWIAAWTAYLDGRVDEAVALYARAAERWPDDPHAPYQAGDILRHEDRFAEALPWFEACVARDPGQAWALAHLVEALAATGRLDALRERAAAWARGPATPAALHALSLARGWLGDVAGAREAARRALALGGGLGAQQDLLAARLFAGEHAAVEQDLRLLADPGSGVRPVGHYALAAVAAYQGRFEAGLAELDALREAVPRLRHDGLYLALRLDYLAGRGDVSALRPDLAALRAADPRAAGGFAPVVAWLGDAELAAELARELPPSAPLARAHAAIATFRRGDREGGLEALRALAAETPFSVWRVAPAFLHGALAAEAGRDAEAVAALQRFEGLYLPRALWRSWALGRARAVRAEAEARLARANER
jgi:hypothetical protein